MPSHGTVNRNRILVLVAAIVCAGGLALAATTIDGPQSASSGYGDGSGAGMGNGSEAGGLPSEIVDPVGPPIPAWVFDVLSAILLISLLMGIYRLIKEWDTEYLQTLLAIFGVVLLLLVIVMLFGSSGEPGGFGDSGGGGVIGSEQDEPSRQPINAPMALLGVFGLVALALIVVIGKLSSTSPPLGATVYGAEETEDEDDDSVEEIAEAAARAADSIEDDQTVENAVYRAWQEMTAALAVERPETTTPEEFATAAVDAGMAPDDVEELTWLFEEIRYGNAPATDERERRARQALRRIETTYGGDEVAAE